MFEWDEAKRQATLEKHGIDFVDAVEIFSTTHLVVGARSEIESRKLAVGELDQETISVIFTIRDDAIRIITARRARRNEREQYYALLSRRNSGDEEPH
ncbi:BrnT family toxin [Marinovum sp.]|uniref:BrnT family toxin n=1 Tax=Marinovum sp. TaxID=2024839 RepID=UPI002B2655EB|nr:BrnT family toxin [Marinovum sp.]